ncbi:hypothetical protein MLGJGCBP_05395 [Rhodococcus sp. T7]|nr:hypothetical protein [Rhodococcus sp. T7]KAF0957832.1 hypothetical protein MLGJGCBP_09664 [Rhodococcus sp. T7]KAF0961515.1 hypothetical protein MLGJGCBP_05395 [Rhodococcus sp. T7]
MTHNDPRYGAAGPIVATLAVTTATQRRAFELVDTTIPLTVNWLEQSQPKAANPQLNWGFVRPHGRNFGLDI